MIKKAQFLAKEVKLRVKYMTNNGCLFCKIIKGEVQAECLDESDKSYAFSDANPVYKTHILIIPKNHIDSVLTLNESDAEVLLDMYNVAKGLVEKNKIDAFRLAFNGGKYQHVPHLHMHLMAGDKLI